MGEDVYEVHEIAEDVVELSMFGALAAGEHRASGRGTFDQESVSNDWFYNHHAVGSKQVAHLLPDSAEPAMLDLDQLAPRDRVYSVASHSYFEPLCAIGVETFEVFVERRLQRPLGLRKKVGIPLLSPSIDVCRAWL